MGFRVTESLETLQTKGEVREIAAMGGRASHGAHDSTTHKEDLPGHGNPGNFANHSKEEIREIASMGGPVPGAFADMDPEKQVGATIYPSWALVCDAKMTRTEAAARGGGIAQEHRRQQRHQTR
ncbi:hypothetical protein C7212DRAFT_340485 [Tuber magnatum]|uniref:Uncharacterized protein n=1 Tax=Tuber magnatum TaxID=42249 RepID=A0A317SZ87_9PEZI|nr:hypothetical protein C7212DRAFT_340485 [Tuber magnatum]